MKLKVLLLGKTGLLGGCFFDQFSGLIGFELYAPNREELDLVDESLTAAYIMKVKPEVVINCTGYTAVDDAESNSDMAFMLNGDVPSHLVGLCKEIGATLIHFSTDYVFDGENEEGYLEDADCSPINVYGESKLKGEKAVMSGIDNYYIVRTSWLYGRFGKNFVNTMMELARTKSELNVVFDQIGSPTYANDLATFVINNFVTKKGLPFGIYHLTNSDKCSWFEFAKEIFNIPLYAFYLGINHLSQVCPV